MSEELYSKSKKLGYDYIKDRGTIITIDPNDPSKDLNKKNYEYSYYDGIYTLKLQDLLPKRKENEYYVKSTREEIESKFNNFLDSIFNIPNVANGLYEPYFILKEYETVDEYGSMSVLFKRYETEDEFIEYTIYKEEYTKNYIEERKKWAKDAAKENLLKLTKEEREEIMKELNNVLS